MTPLRLIMKNATHDDRVTALTAIRDTTAGAPEHEKPAKIRSRDGVTLMDFDVTNVADAYSKAVETFGERASITCPTPQLDETGLSRQEFEIVLRP